ncbi:unnamed protein product [Brassica napus]|uniref:(rape) hypothetical protein n=1 Tax=Brassica napus TaxID=3708 RepID=A0A816YA12_BRANA|nr:unnamed protein product [Brassica napus]
MALKRATYTRPSGQEPGLDDQWREKSESGLEATHAPAARLPTLSRSFGSQRHVSLAKSVRRKHRSDRLEL